VEQTIRAAGKSKNRADSSVEMIYDVLQYASKCPCSISETISIILWDIDAFRSLAPYTASGWSDRPASQWNDKTDFSGDGRGLVTSVYCITATNEKPRAFPGIVIGHHK
jgi:hypothetical protein